MCYSDLVFTYTVYNNKIFSSHKKLLLIKMAYFDVVFTELVPTNTAEFPLNLP